MGAGLAAVGASIIAREPSKKIALPAPGIQKNSPEGAVILELVKKNVVNLQHALEMRSAS